MLEALAAYDRVVGLDLSEVSIDGRRSGCRGHRRLVFWRGYASGPMGACALGEMGCDGVVRTLDRITIDPAVMGGKACIRGMRVTAGTVVGVLASGCSTADILGAYPYLEQDDVEQSLAYAAWRLEEREAPLPVP